MTAWPVSAVQPADLEQVLAIEGLAFTRPWGRLSVEGELNAPGAAGFVIREPQSGRVAAYTFFRRIFDEVHIFRIAVAPAWRRRGMGRRLVERCLRHAAAGGARAVLLEVRPSNTEALQLYRGFGFRFLAVRPGYYPDSREDALIFQKDLKQEEEKVL
jgi:[ribosomal protein S18]-alanine N-acetyltransferase